MENKAAPVRSELRLFLSSTFQDLQKEREYLVRKVFPEIRALCRERGVVFTEIDLRWGLTEEEGTLGRIIGACLDEVDRCRPYFIGIFGERYGWVPPYAELYKDPDLLARYPWLEEAAIDGLSIMEMEVAHAVLNDYEGVPTPSPDSDDSSPLFYARRSDNGTERERAVDRLIDRLGESGHRVQGFRASEELGAAVLEDLRTIIDRDFNAGDATPLDREQAYHEAFAVSRRQAYIPDLETLRLLNDFVLEPRESADDSGTLVVRGPSGVGKSALLAYWSHTFHRRHPEVLLIEHFVGVGTGSGDRIDVVRHLMMEVRERIGIDDEIPEDPDEMTTLLPDWLARLGDETTVLLLDGVNQLPEEERDLAWFPPNLPENMRAIVTSTLPLALGETGSREITLEQLDHARREGIIVRFLGEYHKSLSRDRVARIATAPQSAHPLFLRTLLEELRVHGLHEELDRVIDHYLEAPDSEALFALVLGRLEQDFGRERVERIMSLLWCSRNGLSDSELLALIGGSRLELNLLLTTLDYHLLRRGPLYNFFHDYLVRAVEERYLGEETTKRRTHGEIAGWFSGEQASERRAEEEPWGWEQAGDHDRLGACLTDPTLFLALREHGRFGMLRYWRLLEGRYEPVPEYRRMVGETGEDFRTLLELSRFFEDWGDIAEATTYAERAMEAASTVEEEKEARIQVMDVLYDSGKFEELEVAAREALGTPQENDLEYQLEALQYRLVALVKLNRFAEAEELTRKIEEGFEGTRSTGTRIEIYNNLGLVAHQQGNFKVAETWYREALSLFQKSSGESPAIHSLIATNLGTLLLSRGRYEEAYELLATGLDIRTRLFGTKNDQTIITMKAIGDLKMKCGEYQEAESLYTKALKSTESGYSDPFLRATLLSSRASLLHRTTRLREAEAEFLQVLTLLQSLVGEEHFVIATTYRNMGELFRDKGEIERATEALTHSLDLTLRLFGESHPSVTDLQTMIAALTEE